MSGRVNKTRGSAASIEAATTTLNERILKVSDKTLKFDVLNLLFQECHNLYTDVEHGLVDIASSLGLSLLPPRKKITIMLIGIMWK